MKIFLTGATGLLGCHVAHELIRRGYELRLLARPGSNLKGVEGLPFEQHPGCLEDMESLRAGARGCEGVIHTASLTSPWPTAFRYYEEINVNGTIRLVQAAMEAGARRFVFVGTANAFGHGTFEKPGTELSEFCLFRYQSGYVNSKYLAQQYVLEQVEQQGFQAVVVNPTFMLGPLDMKPSSGRLILQGLKGKVQWVPSGGKNFIHVRDAAAGVCQALEKGLPGECYLLAGENLSYLGFFNLLNEVAGHRPIQAPAPAPLLQGLGLLGSLYSWLAGRPALLNRVTSRMACLGNYYSGRKAVEQLGLPQTPIRQAVSEAVEWFRAEGRL